MVVIIYNWKSNYCYCVTLPMHHRLTVSGLPTYSDSRPIKGDEQPIYTPHDIVYLTH